MQVLVLGMHRSGTSVLTHLLSRMGCHAGSPETLKPADFANQRGYWERWDVWALNEQVLAAAQASWREVADLDLDSLGEDDRLRFAAHARELVADLDRHRPWVIKDPRLCVLLPLWRPALTAPVVVFAHRNPLETARSLRERDGLPLAVGFALWEYYNLEALRHSLGMQRLSVSYERLLRDPHGVATELAAALGPLAPGALGVPTAAELAEIVAPDLHHQRARAKEADPYLNANQRKLSRALDAATALTWKAVPACSAGALDILRSFAAGEREKLEVRRRDAESAARCAEAEGEAAWRRDREAEHDRWITSLRAALTGTEAELARLRQREGEISSWNQTLTIRLAEAEAELARLRQREGEISNWNETLTARLAEAEAELARLRQRDAEISSWNDSLAARLTEAESAHRQEAAGLAAQLDELRRQLAALDGLLGETAHHAEKSGLLAGEFDRLVAEILRSRSWRLGRNLTAPARWGRSAVLAESRHEALRRAAENLAAARRSLAAQAARRAGAEEPPPVGPTGGA